MTRHLSVPVKSVCAFSILLSATALSGVPAFAANDDVIDGLPTARACAQLGFSTIDYDEDEAAGPLAAGGGLLRQLAPSLGLAAPDAIAPPVALARTRRWRRPARCPRAWRKRSGDAYYDQPVDTGSIPTPPPTRSSRWRTSRSRPSRSTSTPRPTPTCAAS